VTQQALPSVSICIPTYNQTDYLRMTLDSVFNQEGVDFEVIVSDDSSTDDVFHLIQTYEQNGHVINYYRNNPSLGSPENWNFAIQQAKGNFIKIMHHDDYFTENFSLSKMLVRAMNSESNNTFVFTGSSSTHMHSKKVFYNSPTKESISEIIKKPHKLLKGNIIGSPSATLYRKDLIRFEKNLIWLVDIDFYLSKLYIENCEFIYIDELLIGTIIDKHNITNKCINDFELNLNELTFIYSKMSVNFSNLDKLSIILIMIRNLISMKRKNKVLTIMRFLKRIL